MIPMTPAQRQNMIRAIARLGSAADAISKVANDLDDDYRPLAWACRFLATSSIMDLQSKLKELLEKGAS